MDVVCVFSISSWIDMFKMHMNQNIASVPTPVNFKFDCGRGNQLVVLPFVPLTRA